MRITRMALMVWMAGAVVAHGGETQHKLTVYLRVRTTDRHMLTPLAQGLAAKMFADIGVSLEWRTWEPAGAGSRLPIIIEVVSETSQHLKREALAYAQPYEGSHITVFLDRIERMECPAFVLAHVLVHEITHIVQRTVRHSDTGVMKAHWTDQDIFQMRRKPLPFAPVDLDLFYSGLAVREWMSER